MVSRAHRRWSHCHPQNHDPGARAQAVDRALAPCHHRRAADRRRAALGNLTISAMVAMTTSRRSPTEVAVRRARTRPLRRDQEWTRRPGAMPPMRMIASWSRSNRINRIKFVTRATAPPAVLPSVATLLGPSPTPPLTANASYKSGVCVAPLLPSPTLRAAAIKTQVGTGKQLVDRTGKQNPSCRCLPLGYPPRCIFTPAIRCIFTPALTECRCRLRAGGWQSCAAGCAPSPAC